MHLLKQTVPMQTEVCVNYLFKLPYTCAFQARFGEPYDVTIWLSRTTDNSNIFIRSREVQDNESRLYLFKVCSSVPLIFSYILRFIDIQPIYSTYLFKVWLRLRSQWNEMFLKTCCQLHVVPSIQQYQRFRKYHTSQNVFIIIAWPCLFSRKWSNQQVEIHIGKPVSMGADIFNGACWVKRCCLYGVRT